MAIFCLFQDLAKDLLPLVYGSLTAVLFPTSATPETVLAGEEDLRCAACNALLELPRDLLWDHSNSVVGLRLVDEVWRLLERSAGEFSSATGPLLTLATELTNSSSA